MVETRSFLACENHMAKFQSENRWNQSNTFIKPAYLSALTPSALGLLESTVC